MDGHQPALANNNHMSTTDESDELLQAQAHIWRHIFNFINSMSLKCAVDLGIPDALRRLGRPAALPELAAALSSTLHPKKAHCLPRLMRILVHSGFFAKTPGLAGGEDTYSLTPASSLLLKDNPLSVAPFLLAMLDPLLLEPWQRLGAWLGDSGGATAFEMTHGRPLFELAGVEPRLNRFFNEAMASDARLVMKVVLKECKGVFEGLTSIVDVGGGSGTVAEAIVTAFPEVKCTVLDLPHVVDGMVGKGNLQYAGGDMFEAIPAANAVFLKWIMHDWSDEECVKILKKCKEAIPGKEGGGKVIIVDILVDNPWLEEDDTRRHESIEVQLLFDMEMMALLKGKERNENEWAKLFSDAGFSGYKIVPVVGLRALIEVFP